MRKVGIIGLGNVGAMIAQMIVQAGYVDELVLIDKNTAKSKAEAFDMLDAASLLNSHTKITVGDYPDLPDAEVVISALGHIKALDAQDRFQELKINTPMVKAVADEINASGFNGVFLIVTNPNDVIAQLYSQALNLPKNQVFGTGTYLDSARLHRYIAEEAGVDARSVSGYMLGEHGDSQFAAWSTVNIGGVPFKKTAVTNNFDLEKIEDSARHGGFVVYEGKGYTNFAIAAASVSLMNLILSDAKAVVVCSHYDAELDAYLSTPALVGRDGAQAYPGFIESISKEEADKLKDSAREIQEKIKKFS